MYSIVKIDDLIIIMPSEYVQPTSKIMAFGITTKKQASVILEKIKAKNKTNKQ